jgi:predicted histidine transporter YuiF (NhaC family)
VLTHISQMKCTNVKDFTSCLCDIWMMNCLYFLSKEIIIYSLVLLTSFLSIFNKFERKRKRLQREDSQMKEEDIKNKTTYLDNKVYKTINGVVVSILNTFIMRILGLSCLLQNLWALIKMYNASPYLSLK